MAVALHHRGKGGSVAREMVSGVREAIEGRALEEGCQTVEIQCRVWHANTPSISLCQEAGMEITAESHGVCELTGLILLGENPVIEEDEALHLPDL